ncbi:hypothetical protein SAMN04488518_11063 [Pseudovibrio ascidiaceicola]|uniref:Uncharacterized protein n=1 Tax=Pseudovibrio ascidiaceicola TaxID=285279 RepID=A0A1I4CXB3_9HYPH|nr:hypothetical protein SAMN04488518_11063 [Pseudovibrio ascidiaceicola]
MKESGGHAATDGRSTRSINYIGHISLSPTDCRTRKLIGKSFFQLRHSESLVDITVYQSRFVVKLSLFGHLQVLPRTLKVDFPPPPLIFQTSHISYAKLTYLHYTYYNVLRPHLSENAGALLHCFANAQNPHLLTRNFISKFIGLEPFQTSLQRTQLERVISPPTIGRPISKMYAFV